MSSLRSRLAPLFASMFALASAGALAALAPACGTNVTPAGHDAYVPGETTPLQCAPDLDGVLTAKELQPAYDTPINYLENPAGKTRTVNVAGLQTAGGLVWDFGADYADDGVLTVTVNHLEGKWYAASFPQGQFVSPQDAAHTLEAIYKRDDSGVYLLGIASTEENPAGVGQTLLVYDVGILVAKFPMTAGTHWVAKGSVTQGKVRGLPYSGTDVYDVTDDAVGKVILHDFTFESVHRVRTNVTVTPTVGGKSVLTRQISYFAECFGEIARAVSQNDEPAPDFTIATELRRLGK